MNPHRSRKRQIEKYGHKWDNAKEVERYEYLLLRHKAHEIERLFVKPKLRLVINGIDVGSYSPEFVYFDLALGRDVIEDCKPGYNAKKRQMRKGAAIREWTERQVLRTPAWAFKRKVVAACLGIEVTEVWS